MYEQQYTICLCGGIARNSQIQLATPANLDILNGEHLAIVGPNGSGKSLFIDLLTGKYPLREGTISYDFTPSLTTTAYDNIKYIAFRDTYGSADGSYYYQQRWNQTEQDDVPLVRDLLGKSENRTGGGTDAGCEALKRRLFDLFRIEPMLDKKIILLSSGELRKFQLVKTLLTSPRILIMDNPFIGLDAVTRKLLFGLLDELSRMESLQIILVLSMMDDIPSFITHVVPVADMRVGEKMERETYLTAFRIRNESLIREEFASMEALRQRILDLPYDNINYTSAEVVKLNKVSICYDDRIILKELDWTVMRGEKWALSGENGAGKSTLLSLVCADNPQAYACDISLFGRKRGSGESIWEIKKHIGYVSPEMHRAYLKNLPAIEIVASGLHDSVGLYKRPREEQMAVCEWWMDIFGIAELRGKPFLQLSSGEQRLALLARAFVKDPELLILDEPLHGLDTYNRRRVKKIIEAFCHRKDKTMIMVTHYENELPDTISNRLHLIRNR
ncbi:ATP-binding cassette domain-containing protein [Bacteroides helcogenes]|uniref:ATP-binding cassette domain-containing protein n=1 Tax=Bacteroides helcogenes TaxID=290053 RepID=UPI002A90B51A|nr:ATP-binding cassette domain-containing protein [Bacteroides helcogenes]MDY5239831.1 ATP-binding cassette domain-containing protein [Bacteroides helcogenes]